MAQAEWKKYFMLKDDVFYGKEADFDKLPKSAKEEALLKKSGIVALATDTLSVRMWNALTKEWDG